MLPPSSQRPLVVLAAAAALVVGPVAVPAGADDVAPDPTPSPTAEPDPGPAPPAETSPPPTTPADPAPTTPAPTDPTPSDPTPTPADPTPPDSTDPTPTTPPGGGYDDVNVTQPPTLVRVLPTRCTGPDQVMPSKARACRITPYRRNRPTVVVWGDSHSWQQTPAIVAEARRTRSNLVTFQMGACPPMDLRGTVYGRSECADMGAAAIAYIKRSTRKGKKVTVVAGGAWSLYRDVNAKLAAGRAPETQNLYLSMQAGISVDGIPRAFRTLNAMPRVRVVGIGQMPLVGDNAASCASRTGCDLTRPAAIHREASVRTWLRARVDRTVDATRYVCDRSTCFANVDQRRTFLDELHLDPAIAPRFAPAYLGALRP